ncbi:MAG: DUF389 domain-containing protein [Anaerolineae bacterium]|nr:DUF389 domain-containing protein [Anaerolineae bacterium]
MTPNQAPENYHIVAAVGAESQLCPLLSLACALARSQSGRVTLLHVTPTGNRPAWLNVGSSPKDTTDLPDTCNGVPVSVEVCKGSEAAPAILQRIRTEQPDLLLLGWRGARGGGRYLLGHTLDAVVQSAPCDVAVVRTEGAKSALDLDVTEIKRVLVPAAGGPNAGLAIDLALDLSPDVQVTVLNIARSAQGQVALSLGQERLKEILHPWADEPRVQGKVVQADSIIQGILTEAARGYDLVMIGSSQESYLDRVLFGNIPQTVATRSPAPSVVVRRATPGARVGSLLRRTGWRVFEMLPTLDLHEQIQVYKAIRDGAQPSIDFYVMIGLSAAIASFGLLQNSAAVIIGAMLVAPLMSAIFGLSLGVVRGDLRLLRRAASATLRGMLLGISVGAVLTLVMPAQALPGEVLSRTEPGLLDLGVALASGAAGAYALSRKGVSASLPGVAIAAALVPPLAVVGIGISRGQSDVAGGALLLFLTNLVSIVAAGGLVFLWLGFRPLPGQASRARVFRGGIMGTILMLGLLTALLATFTARSIRESALRQEVRNALGAEIAMMDRVDWEGDWEMEILADGTLQLDVTVRSRRTLNHTEVVALQERVANHLQRTVALLLTVIPTTRLDPFMPPTPTPTPEPNATFTPTPSATATPTATPTFTPTPSPTSTFTATPTPTSTATDTPTPTPTSTATDTPTPTPTPTPVVMHVGRTDGQGVWMFTEPGLRSAKIGALRDGTRVILLGDLVEADGYRWLQVQDTRGRIGWIPDRYLVPATASRP